jgi:hypothetical protein
MTVPRGKLVAVVALAALMGAGRSAAQPPEPSWETFIAAGAPDRRTSDAALKVIAAGWRDAYTAMIVDIARFLPSPRGPQASDNLGGLDMDDAVEGSGGGSRGSDLPTAVRQPPGSEVRRRLLDFLQKQTGKRFGDDLRAWRRWMWSLPPAPHANYAEFKAELYARIDPRFRAFFAPGVPAAIRLDEVDWGGVPINGIPPLRSPKTERASEAAWLRDGHIVFGVLVNGEARAYPKRILAWHEMALDRVGGVDLTVVYCTLCGTVIPYESTVSGRRLSFGTSGLLYRSNKLMFDQESATLWSALEGVPVIGPLVGSGLQLRFHGVVTTTWGEWKRDHPETTVLSIETGFDRDYGENVAYRDYFRSDRLMFEVPATDARLKAKAEVLVLRPEVLGAGSTPVAIPVDHLRKHPVFPFEAGGRALVALTTRGGANRVYFRGAHTFTPGATPRSITDDGGQVWSVTPDALVGPSGERLAAVPTHRVFWFGWFAQHPTTVLLP